MPQMTNVSGQKFQEMLTLVSQARIRNNKLLNEATANGDEDAIRKHIQIELDLAEQHHAVVDLQAKYVASNTERSLAEKELKSLVSGTRKKVRRVKSIADALNTVADVAERIAKFASIL